MSRRIAVVASHPVQYQAPFFRGLAQRADLTVFFCQRHEPALERSAGYTDGFSWDVPLTDGYRHEWLLNVAQRPSVDRYSGCDTPDVADRIAERAFDACIVQGWYLKSYVQAILACRRYHVPVLLRGDSQLATTRSAIKRAIKYWPYRALLNGVAGHLVVGAANREYLTHYAAPASKLFDVPHAVDDQWFATEARAARANGSRERERAAFAIPADAKIAVFVGRLVDMKRPLDLIRALTDSAVPSNLWGLIVGSGPLDRDARALAKSLGARVRFAGFRNQRALPSLYAAADMLVLPSDARETWGLVANEALAAGLPVVVSDAAGCARDLAVGEAGRRYRVGQISQLAAAMTSMAAALDGSPRQVADAVSQRSATFGCEAAVAGTLRAVEMVSGARTADARGHLAAPRAVRRRKL
jgi:glycosyltransferase involved in cell wall biosynthesis